LGVTFLTIGVAPTDTTSLVPPQPTQTDREGSATTDSKLATAVDYSIGLNQSSYDDELKKRKARAARFGAPTEDLDAEAEKAAERAKRFSTDNAANGGVGKLDEALPMERERRGKRGRDGETALDDPGLKQGRGGKRRFQGRGGRNDKQGGKPTGVQKAANKTAGTFSSEKDRLAAEARKKKFATA
jgi:SAP domain-containing ribonucleoprotein